MYIAAGLGGARPKNRRTFKSNESLSLNTCHHVVGIIRAYKDMNIYIDCIKTEGVIQGMVQRTWSTRIHILE